MPLQRRVPKFGFKNNNKVVFKPINLDDLQKLNEGKGLTVITPEVLRENGLVGKNDLIKILGRGELSVAIEVTADKFSDSAKAAIEKAGGSITVPEA
jgi:large subunit ribosomal protein L15